MGYRPVSRKSGETSRQEVLKDLRSQKATYEFLRAELGAASGSPTDLSMQLIIDEVDEQIRELQPPPPSGPGGIVPSRLGPINRSILQDGHLA